MLDFICLAEDGSRCAHLWMGFVLLLFRSGITSWRTFSAIAISSTAALPARSPMPLIVDSTCRAPAVTAASVLATARPRSLWQWVENTTRSLFGTRRSEEHTSELQSLMRISYAVFCLKKKINTTKIQPHHPHH